MATIAQIEAGAAKYIDEEIGPKIPTDIPYGQIKKIAALAGAAYTVKKRLRQFLALPAVTAIGAIDEKGNVDVDGISEEFLARVPKNGFDVDVPILGPLTFFREDVEKLVEYIKEV